MDNDALPWQVDLADLPDTNPNSLLGPFPNTKIIVVVDWMGDPIVIAGPPGLEIEIWDEDSENIPYFEPSSYDYDTVKEFDKAHDEFKAQLAALEATHLTEEGREWLADLKDGMGYSEENVHEVREEIRQQQEENEEEERETATYCNGFFDRVSGTIKHNIGMDCPQHGTIISF